MKNDGSTNGVGQDCFERASRVTLFLGKEFIQQENSGVPIKELKSKVRSSTGS